jgi:uncharacterized protein
MCVRRRKIMRYLTSHRVLGESLQIGMATGAMPPAFLTPELRESTTLSLELVQRFDFGPLNLLLAPHTASWALLNSSELAVAGDARARSLGEICKLHPDLEPGAIKEFFFHLYRRGLVRVDGEPGLNPDILRDGALFREANLVEILVTQKCNLACRYCLAEAGPDMPHLHPEIAYRAVDGAFDLPDDRPLAIQLSGGEPFVNWRLFQELVLYIKEKQRTSGRTVTICTQSNGTLITDEIALFLKAQDVSIGVSIDGPPHLNNRSRPLLGGGASHERTVRGIRVLQRHGFNIGTILVLNRMNVGHPEEIADFMVEIGIRSTKINPISMIGDARSTWDEMAITTDEYFEFLDRFAAHVVDNDLRLREANLAEYLKYLTFRAHDYRCMRSNCGAGSSFFLVDAVGDVYPCAHSAGIPEWRIGTVDEADGDLRQLGGRNPIVAQFKDRLVDEIDTTKRCPWRHLCEGGCAVNAYQKFGTILAPDVLCSFYERWYPRLLDWLTTSPERFQRLLDVMLGKGQTTVVSVELVDQVGRPPSPIPIDEGTLQHIDRNHAFAGSDGNSR